MKIHSVTLDLDGTLLDTVADLAAACDAMLTDLGCAPLGEARVRPLVGKGMAVLVERCLTVAEGRAPDTQRQARGIEAFRHHYAILNGQRASEYPSMRAGLEAFRAMGMPLAIVTNKPAAFTLPLLERTRLLEFFPVVVSGDTTPHKKPHPEPILHACALLGTRAEFNLHIGDSDNDFFSARAAGSQTWAVPYGYTEDKDAVDTANCDALVSSLLEAAQRVAEINGNP